MNGWGYHNYHLDLNHTQQSESLDCNCEILQGIQVMERFRVTGQLHMEILLIMRPIQKQI